MLKIEKKVYEKVIIRIITSNDMREVLREFSLHRVFFYSLLKDVIRGKESPNYHLLEKIAKDRKVSEEFMIEQAKLILSHLGPEETKEDYYQILNISSSSSAEEIRKSWINLMKANHPDRVGDQRLDVAKSLNEAYEVLGNPLKRRRYDSSRVPALPIVVKSSFTDLITHEFIFFVVLGAVILVSGFYLIQSGQLLRTAEKISYLALNRKERAEPIEERAKSGGLKAERELERALPQERAVGEIAKSSKTKESVKSIVASQGESKTEEEYQEEEKPIAGDAVEQVSSALQGDEHEEDFPRTGSSEEPSAEETPGSEHSVKKGDTPGEIAGKSEISAEKLKEENEQTDEELGMGTTLSRHQVLSEELKENDTVALKKTAMASEKEESAGKDNSEIKEVIARRRQNELQAEYSIPERKLSSPPNRQSLYSFVSEYVSSYKNRDIRRFISLFETDAQENGLNISRALHSYMTNFSSLEILRYDVRVRKLDYTEERASVNGDFFVVFRKRGKEELKASSGTISWLLSWNGVVWRIKEINYEVSETGLISSGP